MRDKALVREREEGKLPVYECEVCGYWYGKATEGTPWDQLLTDWLCEVSFSGKCDCVPKGSTPEPQDAPGEPAGNADPFDRYRRASVEREITMADIHQITKTGRSIIDPMRTGNPIIVWNDICTTNREISDHTGITHG